MEKDWNFSLRLTLGESAAVSMKRMAMFFVHLSEAYEVSNGEHGRSRYALGISGVREGSHIYDLAPILMAISASGGSIAIMDLVSSLNSVFEFLRNVSAIRHEPAEGDAPRSAYVRNRLLSAFDIILDEVEAVEIRAMMPDGRRLDFAISREGSGVGRTLRRTELATEQDTIASPYDAIDYDRPDKDDDQL